MPDELNAFLGKGWAFPPSFNHFNHSVIMSSDVEDIEESIRIIINTFPGERIMQPEFGCYLKRLVFEKIDEELITKINDTVSKALLEFEPRIHFINIETAGMDIDAGKLLLRLHYSLIITNTRHNIVFPFYLNEGTNVAE